MTDAYQRRYEQHQGLKRKVLLELMQERHSRRMFAEQPLPEDLVREVLATADLVPSSCDRRAVQALVVDDRDQKALLGGLLVGGVGWVHRAPVVVLLWADPLAYKAGDEVNYMPYIDAGCLVQQLYLAATASGLSCCYVNPNVRELNREHFRRTFSIVFGEDGDIPGIYLGAVAIGYPRESS